MIDVELMAFVIPIAVLLGEDRRPVIG